jgi:hypothetical protein
MEATAMSSLAYNRISKGTKQEKKKIIHQT